ncbi:MAG: hypothetical protein HY760_02715 [Nitrospirae bacterium]|nr:hypothetical protein [Nitrospirota bacterium]
MFLLWIAGFVPTVRAGEAVLTWDPPSANEDGTPLTDLSGFKAYYGTASGVYGTFVDVGNVLTHTVLNLVEGKIYYFAVTAYDYDGNESLFSNEVGKGVLGTPPGNIDLSASGSGDRVDGYDLIALELARGTTPADGGWNPFADLDGNGIVDGVDLEILSQNFGTRR